MANRKENIAEIREMLNVANGMDFRFRCGTISFANPVSIYFAKHGFAKIEKIGIFEGLIRTYPIEKTVEYIGKYFLLGKNISIEKVENGKEHIVVAIPNVGKNSDIMEKAFDVCGYFLSKTINNGICGGVEWITMQFEAKIQEDDSEEIRREEKNLFHLTSLYNKQKILTGGFSPRCRNEIFKYPGRIYFIRGSAGEEEIINLGIQLSQDNNSRGNDLHYVVFDIDVNKIGDEVKIYKDPNYKNGVFIDENIKPDCISRIGEVDFLYLAPKIVWLFEK